MENIKYIPMLYSTPMVQALLDDRKNQTRRTKGLEKINKNPDEWEFWRFFDGHAKFVEKGNNTNEQFIKCPYGEVGDIIWVRETFFTTERYVGSDKPSVFYKASNDLIGCNKWKPSIHMPKAAARIFLEITEVRCERLQDIDEQSAINEGIERIKKDGMLSFRSYAVKYDACVFPIVSFKTLWQSINGEDSWNKNPFVWVIKFKRIDKPLDFTV